MSFIDIPDTDYHSREGLSSSLLKLLLRSPAHFIQHENKETPALIMGRAVHCAALEPEKFAKLAMVSPQVDRRTKAGKEAYDDFMSRVQPDSIILTEADYKTAINVCESARNTGLVYGEMEKSGIYYHEGYGVDLRIRPDIMIEAEGILRDIKTTEDARERPFMRAVRNYDYDLSAALYIDVANKIRGSKVFHTFQWIAVEKSAPYGVMVYTADESLLEQGRQKYIHALETYAECIKNDYFPAYPTEPITLYGD